MPFGSLRSTLRVHGQGRSMYLVKGLDTRLLRVRRSSRQKKGSWETQEPLLRTRTASAAYAVVWRVPDDAARVEKRDSRRREVEDAAAIAEERHGVCCDRGVVAQGDGRVLRAHDAAALAGAVARHPDRVVEREVGRSGEADVGQSPSESA